MSSYYFIGGAPRSGKTTVLERLIKRKAMTGASTDAIRTVAKAITNPQENPRLFKTERGAFNSKGNVQMMLERPEQSLALEIGESEETWKSVIDFLSYYIKDGRNAAIEGVAVLPSALNKLVVPHRAVFIANLSDQTDIVLEHAKRNENDWLHKYDEKVIKAFCRFNRTLNQYYADEAVRFGYPVIDMYNGDFDDNIEAAISLLLEVETSVQDKM